MQYHGRISQWHADRGFGFVEPDEGGERVFVPQQALGPSRRVPAPGDTVRYSLGRDSEGRPRARQAQLTSPERPRNPPAVSSPHSRRKGPWGLRSIVAIAWVSILTAGVIWGGMPAFVLGLTAALSLVAFHLYGMDKSAARHGEERIAENTLHGMALLGGWPGALLAQSRFRHKWRKVAFLRVFWLTVVLNVSFIGWLAYQGWRLGF